MIRRILISSFMLLSFGIAASALEQGFPGGFSEAFGERFNSATRFESQSNQPAASLGMMHRWNRIAIDASGLDHTPVAPGENRVFGEQIGPGRSSRAMAIVHVAIFDAMNAVRGGYQSYTGIAPVSGGCSTNAAIAQAAHDTLRSLFPSQRRSFNNLLAEDLSKMSSGPAKSCGISVGHRAANAILSLRKADGSQHPEPRIGIEFITRNKPGKWRQDPISLIPIALGAYWGKVKPFVLKSSDQFRVSPPPALDSPEYTNAFNRVKALGGDGVETQTSRTGEQTEIGIYWAYDGTPSLCAPPRLYNQIAMHIADQRGTTGIELARLLALVNVAMADAGIAIWESKYHYLFWRPVTGIREADEGTGPTGDGDGNPSTIGDPFYSPLGAPASNLQVPTSRLPFPRTLPDMPASVAPSSKFCANSTGLTTSPFLLCPMSSTA